MRCRPPAPARTSRILHGLSRPGPSRFGEVRCRRRSGATSRDRASPSGRPRSTLRAALSSRQGASRRLYDEPHRTARRSCPVGTTAPLRPWRMREVRAGPRDMYRGHVGPLCEGDSNHPDRRRRNADGMTPSYPQIGNQRTKNARHTSPSSSCRRNARRGVLVKDAPQARRPRRAKLLYERAAPGRMKDNETDEGRRPDGADPPATLPPRAEPHRLHPPLPNHPRNTPCMRWSSEAPGPRVRSS